MAGLRTGPSTRGPAIADELTRPFVRANAEMVELNESIPIDTYQSKLAGTS